MTQLSKTALAAVEKFMKKTAEVAGVAFNAGMEKLKFTVEPTKTQVLQEKIVANASPFLALINILPVSDLKGDKILMDADRLVSGRTDTDINDREPTDPTSMEAREYELFAVETEVAIKYNKIDLWAKFKDFAVRWNALIRKSIANDRLRAAWNGTHAARQTNKTLYPNGEDIAPGWLYQIRNFDSGAQYVSAANTDIILGSAEYPNLNFLVAVVKSGIPEVFRNDPDLVAIISADLASTAEQSFYFVNGNDPVQLEKLAALPMVMKKTYGGLPCYVPPFFPAGTILVTALNNLSIYYQDTSWRRTVVDEPRRNRYADYSSRNEGYVVETLEKCSLMDGITVYDAEPA